MPPGFLSGGTVVHFVKRHLGHADLLPLRQSEAGFGDVWGWGTDGEEVAFLVAMQTQPNAFREMSWMKDP